MKIGIDAGGTLTKVVYLNNDTRTYDKILTHEINNFIKHLKDNHQNDAIYLTGGKAEYISEHLTNVKGITNEFDATFLGLKQLLKESGHQLSQFVYLNVGTGTSFHKATTDTQKRLGGTGIGGGTLIGLSQLLTGISDYKTIVELAKEGSRDIIDLKVHHIYGGKPAPIPGDLTASNFGHVIQSNVEDMTDADKIQAVIGLIAETITTIGINLAEGNETKDIVFIGSTLYNNTIMQEIINRYARLKEAHPIIVNDGEYSGALGSII